MSYVRLGDGMISDETTGEIVRWDREYPAHYCASALRSRGWTDAMIRDLLGDADLSITNPYFTKSHKARLWSRSRVEQAEAGPEFRERAAARRTETYERRTDRRSDSAPRTTDA